MVSKGVGYKFPIPFLELAKDALDPDKQYYALLKSYRAKRLAVRLMPVLAKQANAIGDADVEKEVAYDYIDHQLADPDADDFWTEANIRFMGSYLRGSSDLLFKMAFMKPGKVNAITNDQAYSRKVIDIALRQEEITPKLWKTMGVPLVENPNWEDMVNDIAKKYDQSTADRVVLDAKIDWYTTLKNWPLAAKYNLEKLDRFGYDLSGISWGFLNNVLIDIALDHEAEKSVLQQAIWWQERVVTAKPDRAAALDTYACLLYKFGRTKEAIEWEGKAIKVDEMYTASIKRAPSKELRDTLEKMQKGLPLSPASSG